MTGTALVTGASGFCAVHLIRRLRTEGVNVVGADCRPSPMAAELDAAFVVDLTDDDAVRALICRERPDYVFHLAGIARGEPSELFRVNSVGTVNLLEALRLESSEARVLLVGSAAEYGLIPSERQPISEEEVCRPVGAYGVSKHSATLAGLDYASRYGLRVVVARPFNIVGPGIGAGLLVGDLLRRVTMALKDDAEPLIRVGNLEPMRDFVAVQDVMDAYVGLVQSDNWGQVFNICGGTATPVRCVVEELLRHAPRYVRWEVDPALFRAADVPLSYGSYEKAREAFGYVPRIPLEEAIASAWEAGTTG